MAISGVTLLAFTTAIAVKRIWDISFAYLVVSGNSTWQFLARHFITLGRDESADLSVDTAYQFVR